MEAVTLAKQVPIAVAIATADRPQSFEHCLRALEGGKRLPAEVIIVDQSEGSATEALIASYRPTPFPLRYIRQERLGLSASRNAAIRSVHAQVIAFTDDDCVPSSDWVAALHLAFSTEPSPDAVTGRVLPLGPSSPGRYAVSSRPDPHPRVWSGKVAPWSVGTGANVAVRQSWIARLGGYHEQLGVGTAGRAGEDQELLGRLLLAGACIRYEPQAVIYHERQDGARRLRSRSAYGHGVGACCALMLRNDRGYASYLFADWLAMRGRLFGIALLQQRWRSVREESMVLKGTFQGIRYGLSLAPAINYISQVREQS